MGIRRRKADALSENTQWV